jgi:hypothetical protein
LADTCKLAGLQAQFGFVLTNSHNPITAVASRGYKLQATENAYEFCFHFTKI